MERYFTKSFGRFLTGFLVIIGIAFALMLVTSAWHSFHPVDNIALPE